MLKQLASFVAVFETRHFSRAAELCFRSQPTVSTHIQQLEDHFNVRLFTRNGRTDVIPTPAAQELYPKALQLLADWQTTENTIQHHPQPARPFKVAASHTSAIARLPEIFSTHLLPQSQFAFEIKMANSEAILQAVRDHECDLGIIEKPIITDGVYRVAIPGDQLVRAGHATDPLWLLREHGSGVYHFTQQYLAEHAIVPQKTITVASNDMIIALLKAGIGQSLVSQHLLPADVPYDALSNHFSRHFYLIAATQTHDPQKKAAIDQVMAAYAESAGFT